MKEATVTNHNYIGRATNSGINPIHALFDEFKMFDRGLSAEEIAVEMNKKQPFVILEI